MAGDEEIEVLLFDQPLQKGSFIESQPKPSVYGVALDWWPQSLFYFVRLDWLQRWLLIGGLGISVACVQRVEAEPEMSQRVEVVNVH